MKKKKFLSRKKIIIVKISLILATSQPKYDLSGGEFFHNILLLISPPDKKMTDVIGPCRSFSLNFETSRPTYELSGGEIKSNILSKNSPPDKSYFGRDVVKIKEIFTMIIFLCDKKNYFFVNIIIIQHIMLIPRDSFKDNAKDVILW